MRSRQVIPPAPARRMRVFVSSTFRDMQAERDELVKFVFPQIRKLCDQRGVAWGEVDLRWGITDEQSAEGQVLPICLDEILRCPYFIGLLGERYGSVLETIPHELVEREPWLAGHCDRSVTELEMLHGVLNDPQRVEHALFYFRDPAYPDSFSERERNLYRETATEKETREHTREEVERRVQARQDKLARLKERIRASPFPPREEYRDPKQLGEWVLRDLTEVIDRHFPEGTQPGPLDREAYEHEVFASSRSQVYIGGRKYFKLLEAHVRDQGPPLVILGESGSGKSALLANWALQYRSEHPDELVLLHFIGATPAGTDWAAILRRILGELKRRFDFQEEIPQEAAALRNEFPNWLHRASQKGRVVLILDALNQLEDRDGAPDLVWLPPSMPPNVHVILSTLPGRALDELKRRSLPTLTVKPLSVMERKQLIIRLLARSTKSLNQEQINRISKAPPSHNPLFLRALLEELRVFGYHEELDRRIDSCLSALDIPSLFELILQRCEQDYDRHRAGLVRDSLSLLWASRRGLSETEWLDLLGTDGGPVPHAYWSPFFLALEQSFINRAGLFSFFHDYLRQAIQRRYLPRAQDQQQAHLRLASYFELHEAETRSLDELPWQLCKARDWPRLFKRMGDLEFFSRAWSANRYDVEYYWAELEGNSAHRIPQAYQHVLESPEKHSLQAAEVASLLFGTGYIQESLSLNKKLAEFYERIDLPLLRSPAIGNQGINLMRLGEFDGALALFQEQAALARQTGNPVDLQSSLNNQGMIYYTRNQLDLALAVHQEQAAICQNIGFQSGLQAALGNQARVLSMLGKKEVALELFRQQERICREIGDLHALQRALGNQAAILAETGQADEGLALLEKQEQICLEIGNKEGLALVLRTRAVILKEKQQPSQALALLEQQEQISRAITDRETLMGGLNLQARIHFEMGDMERALDLYREQETISRQMGEKAALNQSLISQASILYDRGQYDAALALYEESEQLSRELDETEYLAQGLGAQADILLKRGETAQAWMLFQRQEQVARQAAHLSQVASAYGGYARVSLARGELEQAIQYYEMQVETCQAAGNRPSLAQAVENLGETLLDAGEGPAARKNYIEAEKLYRDLEDQQGQARALNKLGISLLGEGQPGKALEYFQRQERIGRQSDLKEVLAASLGNQGMALRVLGKPDQAVSLHEQSEQIFRELGDLDGAQRALGNRANVLYDLGERQLAIQLLHEKEEICRLIENQASLAQTLYNLSAMLLKLNDKEAAAERAEQAHRLASDLGLDALLRQVKAIRDYLRQ